MDDKTYEKLSIYDLSGGQIENVSRKYLINKISSSPILAERAQYTQNRIKLIA